MKYSGSDFKFTSQANHLQKLLSLKAENHRENIHAQRLYKRRRLRADTSVMSNWMVLNQSALDGQSSPTQSSSINAASANSNNQYITIINNYGDDDSAVYDWEPIKQ